MYLHLGPCGYFFLYLPSHLLGTYTLLQQTLSLEFSQSIYLLCGRSPPDGCSASAACLLYLRIISLPLGLWKTIVLYLFSVLLMAAEASILFPPQWFLSHARTWSSQSWYRLWSPLPLPEPILVPGWENHNTPEYARCRHTGFIQGKKKMFPVLFSIPIFAISGIWFVCVTRALEHSVDIFLKIWILKKDLFPEWQ